MLGGDLRHARGDSLASGRCVCYAPRVHGHSRARPESVAAAPRSAWIRGPAWDGLWTLSALWLVPLVFWLARGVGDPEDGPLDVLYLGLSAAFWIGHRVCSTYLAYGTAAYRPLVRAQPLRFVVVPSVVALACFAILLPADGALPWPRAERYVVLAIVDYVFVTYHFAAQHFGVLSLYRMRAGRAACTWTRLLDRWFALGVGGALVVLADVLAGAVAYQDRWVGQWAPIGWLASAEDGIRSGALLALAAACAVMVTLEARASRWSVPRLLYVGGVSLMVALALQPRNPFLFLVLWTSQHWIVATGLASRAAAAEPAPPRGFLRVLHPVNVRPPAVVALLLLASVLLLPVFEVEANFDGGRYYGDRIFGAFAGAFRTSSFVSALLALGFASGFVHYVLDRAVYRFSDPAVRAAARGLLQTSEEQRDVVGLQVAEAQMEASSLDLVAPKAPSDIRAPTNRSPRR